MSQRGIQPKDMLKERDFGVVVSHSANLGSGNKLLNIAQSKTWTWIVFNITTKVD